MVTRVVIEGHFYDQSAKETAKELGINYSTLQHRIKSKTEKWKEWNLSDLDFDIKINGKNYSDIDSAIFTLLDIKHKISKEKRK